MGVHSAQGDPLTPEQQASLTAALLEGQVVRYGRWWIVQHEGALWWCATPHKALLCLEQGWYAASF